LPLPQILLTAMMLFVDTSNGSRRLLRLVIASIVSAFYLAVLALVRPYKQTLDLAFACVSNLLLTCFFVCGIVLQLCEEGRWSISCKDFFGLSSSYSASELVVVLSSLLLAIFGLVVVGKTAAALATPTLRLAASGQPPVLDLTRKLHYHLFFSHVWNTGQDQARARTPRSWFHLRRPQSAAHLALPAATSDACARAASAAYAARHPHLARRGRLGGHWQVGGGGAGRGGRSHLSLGGLLCEQELQAFRRASAHPLRAVARSEQAEGDV